MDKLSSLGEVCAGNGVKCVMSRNLKHYQALDALVTYALCTIGQQGGFWSVKRRVIKPKVKHPQFSTFKPEIKTMLSIGRISTGNLERKFWRVNRLNLEYQVKFSQADELYIMLSGLFEQHLLPLLKKRP